MWTGGISMNSWVFFLQYSVFPCYMNWKGPEIMTSLWAPLAQTSVPRTGTGELWSLLVVQPVRQEWFSHYFNFQDTWKLNEIQISVTINSFIRIQPLFISTVAFMLQWTCDKSVQPAKLKVLLLGPLLIGCATPALEGWINSQLE